MQTMKLKIFFLLAVNIIDFGEVQNANACGPWNPIIPTPEFFEIKTPKKMGDYDRTDNLRLWQLLTNENIPLADIEQVVYKDSRETFEDYAGYNPKPSSNLMYRYLNNSNDWEVYDFLRVAKNIEEKWGKKQSPWYYPQSKNHSEDLADFHEDIEFCKGYKGNRLKDRYALQVVRSLFASHQYESCIEYYNSVFSLFPDTNLMKRMAQRYVAGSWAHLGDISNRVDSIFAKAGDIWSINPDYCVQYMMENNPNAPQIMEYIRAECSDVKSLTKIIPIAQDALTRKDVINKGDWAFLLAYCSNEFGKDSKKAGQYLIEAMKYSFTTEELHNLAKAYKMKVEAINGNSINLLSDLKWIEQKCDVLNADAIEWLRRIRNILYVDWIPRLWKKKDYAMAILISSYADNLTLTCQMQDALSNGSRYYRQPIHSMYYKEMRESEEYRNSVDYGSLSFQMMGSLTSSELATTYIKMMSPSPLYSFLRKNSREDRDYYYELIGTLALREENYSRAISYLTKVSEKYQRTMNIFKDGYLGRDPFTPYPKRWRVYYGEWELETVVAYHNIKSYIGAKLEFARAMQDYKHQMQYGKTDDDRGWAKLMYAIGRRNSFEECWALTQYWRGDCTGIFSPDLDYYKDDFGKNNYGFLYDYEKTVGHKVTESIFQKEIALAMAMIQSDELRAKAEYLFGNVVTVIKRYPNTQTGALVKASCDRWESWL